MLLIKYNVSANITHDSLIFPNLQFSRQRHNLLRTCLRKRKEKRNELTTILETLALKWTMGRYREMFHTLDRLHFHSDVFTTRQPSATTMTTTMSYFQDKLRQHGTHSPRLRRARHRKDGNRRRPEKKQRKKKRKRVNRKEIKIVKGT